jgi:hypothetical protein
MMTALLANSHRQDMQRQTLPSLRQYFEAAFTSSRDPEGNLLEVETDHALYPIHELSYHEQRMPITQLIGEVIPSVPSWISGITVSGNVVDIAPRFLRYGMLAGARLPIPSEHSYICLWQDFQFDTEFVPPEPGVEGYWERTGAYSVSMEWRVLDADVDPDPWNNLAYFESQQGATWRLAGGAILARCRRNTAGSFVLSGTVDSFNTTRCTNPAFMPYQGFGVGANGMQEPIYAI